MRGHTKNRGEWNIVIVTGPYSGTTGEVRAVKLVIGNKAYESAIQHLYTLELSCNEDGINLKEDELKVDTKEFQPRRNAGRIANFQIKDQVEDENDGEWSITPIHADNSITYIEHFKTLHLIILLSNGTKMSRMF